MMITDNEQRDVERPWTTPPSLARAYVRCIDVEAAVRIAGGLQLRAALALLNRRANFILWAYQREVA